MVKANYFTIKAVDHDLCKFVSECGEMLWVSQGWCPQLWVLWQILDEEISQVCRILLLCQLMNSAADSQKSSVVCKRATKCMGREKFCAKHLRKTQQRGADAGGEGTMGTHQGNNGTLDLRSFHKTTAKDFFSEWKPTKYSPSKQYL